jgi:hypothetical protein
MPRDGSLVFGDLLGKLTTLVVVCDKCGRRGRYNVARLIEQHSADAKMTDWYPEGDCLKRRSVDMNDRCGAQYPDLVKVLGRRLRCGWHRDRRETQWPLMNFTTATLGATAWL